MPILDIRRIPLGNTKIIAAFAEELHRGANVVHHIIGRQIPTKAQATVWQRLQEQIGSINAESILNTDAAALQSCGMTVRKTKDIRDFALRVKKLV